MRKLYLPFREDRLNRLFDKLTFTRILLVWLGVVFIFGLLYHFVQTDFSHLNYSVTGDAVGKLLDSIYFSFVTATTTGFGDIAPHGYFKIIAIFEVVLGLLLLAVVTSKLVSIKQDIVLNEIYEMSLNQSIERQRTTLLLFRQNLNRIVSKIESGSLPSREVKEIHLYLTPLREALNEILMLFPKKNREYLKRADPASTEVLFNSVMLSFEKISEAIDVFEERCKWRKDIGINIIRTCIDLNEKLFERIHATNLAKKSIDDLQNQKDRIIVALYKKLK